MNREIKFDYIWKNEDGTFRHDIWQLVEIEEAGVFGANRCVAKRQFTGLKGMNDEDIYEGDIIRLHNWGIDDYVIGVTAVVWDSEESGWRYENNHGIEDFYDQFRCVEVIGNIYENPELLES